MHGSDYLFCLLHAVGDLFDVDKATIVPRAFEVAYCSVLGTYSICITRTEIYNKQGINQAEDLKFLASMAVPVQPSGTNYEISENDFAPQHIC